MLYSHRNAYLALKLGLAAIFLWFGIDKFIHPNYWINAWVPGGFIDLIEKLGLDSLRFVYVIGIFEILIGLSFILEVFTKIFSFLGIIFLIVVIISVGLNEIIIRDIGLIGGLLAVFFWPKARIDLGF